MKPSITGVKFTRITEAMQHSVCK